MSTKTLERRHNECNGVLNHQYHDCSLNRLFKHASDKTSKIHVSDLCERNSPYKRAVSRKMFPFDDVIMTIKYHCIYPTCYVKNSRTCDEMCTFYFIFPNYFLQFVSRELLNACETEHYTWWPFVMKRLLWLHQAVALCDAIHWDKQSFSVHTYTITILFQFYLCIMYMITFL